MAVQSHHDVVNQSLSTDALSSVDVSVSNATILAARAAGDASSNLSLNAQLPASTDNPPQAAVDASGPAKIPEALAAGAGNDTSLEEDARGGLLGDGSVGSDTDTSRADLGSISARDADGRENLSRNAIKKSASFKPVSVTKNFLAKAGSTALPTKPTTGGEKAGTPGGSPGPSVQSTPRPRLVAKSISGQKGTLPKPSASLGGSGQPGPDPNQVWNKNRVLAPTATPKHMTDEELRQQYGIQLASRPIEDTDSNQAKWADIDDEDDWAPETIEWNDGTKINLAETTAQTTTDGLNVADESPKEEPAPEVVKSTTPQPKSSSVGPNPTVLKLGAATLQKSNANASKSVPEKPTLVAKPASTAPVKSPWATLPAVEKVSPVQINPPAQNPPLRFGQRDVHGFESMPPPAKEIEADDFSRFLDIPNGNSRELYVPQSGRYEPVNDARRMPSRRDGNFRQPSVLQRPSQSDRDYAGPAEPSPAFQTNRTQQDGSSWGRRRGSSSASLENTRFPRHMSVGANQDPRGGLENPARRGSQLDQRDESPSHSHGVSATSHSPTMSTGPGPTLPTNAAVADEAETATAPPVQSIEDAVEVQKRLMREKREAAIKRRQEQEAKEEAERRERIRQKMESLGMLADKAETKADEPEAKSKDSSQPAAPALKPRDTKESRTSLIESPPKPPIPSPSGEPLQYGLMKVHAPQPAVLASPKGLNIPPRSGAVGPSPNDAKPAPRAEPKSQLANGDPASHSSDIVTPEPEALSKENSSEARPWSNLQPQTSGQFSNWSANTMATHSPQGGNLWGPPPNHRALGNGDFQRNLQRTSLKSHQAPYAAQGGTAPQPVGTPRQFPQPSSSALTSTSKSDLLAGTIIEDLQTVPAFPSERDHLSRAHHSRPDVPAEPRTQISPNSLQPSPNAVHSMHSQQPMDVPKTGVAAWAHFSQHSGHQEAEQAAQEHAARMAEQQLGLTRPQQLPTLNETWKQVKRGDGHGTRQIVGTTTVTNNYAPSAASSSHTVDFNKTIGPPITQPHARSRYQDIFDHQHRFAASSPPQPRPRSPNLPPPDSAEHPAFGLDKRPLVNLPGSRPKSAPQAEKPVVKLPPPKQLPPLVPRSTAVRQMSWSNIVKSQPVTSWQNRIDHLLDRESKVASPPVLSATKPHFDLPPTGAVTAVSLPSAPIEDLKLASLTKTVEEEEALLEERAFGSIPTVRVPRRAAVEMWNIAPRPDYKKFPARALRDDHIFTVRRAVIIPGEDIHDPHSTISILLPGMAEVQLKPFHRKGHGSTRTPKSHGRPKPRSGPKAREPPSDQPNHNRGQPTSASTTSTSGNKGKSGFGGRQTSFNRRASGVAS